MSTGVQRASNQDKLELSEALSQLNETVLGMIRAQAPLPKVLEVLCQQIEKRHSDMLCSVLLLDADGTTLRSGAAPSLPKEYTEAINGVQIGPCVGSCGTAAYRKEPVIVSDIATDALWANCREKALSHGLRACWSTPIASQDGTILGTFAIYYREPRTPVAKHLQLIAHATHLAGIAIEQDRAKAELRAAEARYRTLVERLPAITYVAELGADGPWHYVSPQIETMLGFSPAEWLSDPMNWMNHIHPEDREIALAAEQRFQETHELFQSEYRMCARDGRLMWFRDEGVLLNETDGQRPLMQGVMYDITERKRLEDQLRHSQKMEAVGQLAGGVAHDFNNLLMLIQAHNEHLRDQLAADDPAIKDALEIETAVTRAAALTGQLLAFSRKQVLRPKVLDLNVVLAEVAKMLHRLIGKDIELRVDASSLAGEGQSRSRPDGADDPESRRQFTRCHAEWGKADHRNSRRRTGQRTIRESTRERPRASMSCWKSATLAAGWIVKLRLTCLNPSSPPRHPAKALDWASLRSTEWLNIVTVGSGSTVNRDAELVSRSIFPGLKKP